MVDDITFAEAYRPPQVPPAERSPGDRDRPVNYPVYEDREHFLATVHGFGAGGFEASIREVDLQALVNARMRPRGARKPESDRDPRDVVRSVARSRKTIRHCVKTIGADHMLTLTTREDENSPESLMVRFKRFVRAYRSFSKDAFDYVAVPERHPTNPKHWHLHIAVRGWVKLNIARQVWWNCCGGRGMGGIDVKRFKVSCHPNGSPKGPLVKSEMIARYLSKYMGKDLIFAHRPDKKRYWRSEFDLPEARRYWLKTRPGGGDYGLTHALHEFLNKFGLTGVGLSTFIFPDGSGLWLSYNPDSSNLPTTHPPPF
ncbi:MAG: hypothetical protein Q8L40_11610 [Burkholderiales bacterium]|nr:hypothetical protein [Burkholderiales bacterium]